MQLRAHGGDCTVRKCSTLDLASPTTSALPRLGANYAVFVNTGAAFDGSDSGATPDEAVSWGKVRADARPIKVHADATLIMPLLVSQTFAKNP